MPLLTEDFEVFYFSGDSQDISGGFSDGAKEETSEDIASELARLPAGFLTLPRTVVVVIVHVVGLDNFPAVSKHGGPK